jgi:hypothetical protein
MWAVGCQKVFVGLDKEENGSRQDRAVVFLPLRWNDQHLKVSHLGLTFGKLRP